MQLLAVEQTVLCRPFAVVHGHLLVALLAEEVEELCVEGVRLHQVLAGGAEVHAVAVEGSVLAAATDLIFEWVHSLSLFIIYK